MTPEDVQTSQAHKVLEFMEANGIAKEVLHYIIEPKKRPVHWNPRQEVVEDPVRDQVFHLYEQRYSYRQICKKTGRSDGSIRGLIQRGINHGLIQKRPQYGTKTAFTKVVA